MRHPSSFSYSFLCLQQLTFQKAPLTHRIHKTLQVHWKALILSEWTSQDTVSSIPTATHALARSVEKKENNSCLEGFIAHTAFFCVELLTPPVCCGWAAGEPGREDKCAVRWALVGGQSQSNKRRRVHLLDAPLLTEPYGEKGREGGHDE